ncbi:hypothetical protein JN11_02740 [Mucilaginibacter frigoritolerans]|uniref:Uncharacterized protein n=1 Tax=Mucilaginibacter frigoritolerans TaxID=652788 RepID=A0A562U120_9SPHI|nr:DUF6515 family protein [Mucilaginibacter frigoritolerans]TWI99423.1 hypothetical protein JN11_02740 [Mucilaginibacter frigoritolerans]
MKKLFKYGSGLFLVGLFSIMMVSTANAQRGFHGGGGGGMHLSGGGGGGSFSGAYRGGSLTRTTGVGSYRSGSGYFAGVGYHGGAFYRPGFGYYGYPHWGFYVGILPFGYYPFYWGSDLYYYYGGVFYTPYDNGGYQVTAPPIGAGIPELPSNAQAIKIDGVQYYEASGVYYKETTDDKGKKIYVVAGRDGVLNTDANTTDPNAAVKSAAPQVGDIVNELPDGCHKVSLNGKKYYVSPNDIYYEKVTDPNGNVAFKIVSLPTPDDEKGA